LLCESWCAAGFESHGENFSHAADTDYVSTEGLFTSVRLDRRNSVSPGEKSSAAAGAGARMVNEGDQ